MKSISASIVVLAGAMLIAAGAFHRHNQTSSGLVVLGILVGVAGLGTWASLLRKPEE